LSGATMRLSGATSLDTKRGVTSLFACGVGQQVFRALG
jgi:hypothetical protein